MVQEDFTSLDFYSKLDYMIGICGEAYRGLKRVVNEREAWAYIEKTCTILDQEFTLFSVDEDFNNSDNFREDYEHFRRKIADVLEITSYIIKGNAHYSYLVKMLESLISIIENNFPRNVRLARMFKTLVNNKEELAKRINVDEGEVERVLFNMLKNIDEVDDIVKNGSQYKRII